MTTTTGRKVRADAKLEHLNEAQRARLHFLFEDNCSYDEVVVRLRNEFGLLVSVSTVSAYWRRHFLPLQQEDDAEDVVAFAARPAGDFDGATLQRAKALLWSALTCIHPNLELATKLSGIIDKAERRALAVRKLELEERKVAAKAELAARRAAKAELGTTKYTKKHERVGVSAGGEGGGEGAEVAAKAQGREGRSEGVGGGKVENREIGNVENGGELKNEQLYPPRFPGYSAVNPRQAEEPRTTRKDTKEAEGVEASKELSGVVGEKAVVAGEMKGADERDKAGCSPVDGGGNAARVAAASEKGELLRGMTPRQVVRVWGVPRSKEAALRDFGRCDVWIYGPAANERCVYFEGGVVSSWTEEATETAGTSTNRGDA